MNATLWIVTVILFFISFLKDKQKTKKAIKIGAKRLWKITPLFIAVMGLYAISVAFVDPTLVSQSLDRTGLFISMIIALIIGSLASMPGFIAYPLCALLCVNGVPYAVLAVFSVSLMNVGIVTMPFEVRYLGWKASIYRNVLGIFLSLGVGVVTGIVFGEITI